MTTLQGIFQTHFKNYASKHRMPLKHHQAANAIMACRTAEMGGHEQHCPDGHESHIQYHSCRHRSCPKCNALPKERWAQQQAQRLLAVNHYHLTFTLPHELLPLWRHNHRWFAHTLFHAVSQTLLTLAKDKKHLGALPGLLLSLHTWGRNLILHPHIHCLMSGGGLTASGEWKSSKDHYLFPSRVVRALYQGKLLAALWQGLRSGVLTVPAHMTEREIGQCLKQLSRKKWNVRIQPPYRHGQGVTRYLARYVKGGPISDQRILSDDEESIQFRYLNHRNGKNAEQRLTPEQFIARLLDHVPESRQHVIRHYGLYGHQASAKRAVCRELLGMEAEKDSQDLSWTDYLEKGECSRKGACQKCGKRLVRGIGVAKKSLIRGQVARHVQHRVQADILTWQLAREKPPNSEKYFFGSEMLLN